MGPAKTGWTIRSRHTFAAAATRDGRELHLILLQSANKWADATALWFAFQFIVNVGVCSGLLPTKGLTLPFVSYGGSSILVNCLVIGIVMRAAYESQR